MELSQVADLGQAYADTAGNVTMGSWQISANGRHWSGLAVHQGREYQRTDCFILLLRRLAVQQLFYHGTGRCWQLLAVSPRAAWSLA